VINMLRIQFERQRSGMFPSIHEYARLFAWTANGCAAPSRTSCCWRGADQPRVN